jgi:hypothetical protein
VRVVDDTVRDIVVQIGAGAQRDAAVVDGFVESFEQGGIRPRLIRGMRAFPRRCTTATPRNGDAVLVAEDGLGPLLQLDDDDVRNTVV